MGCVKNVVDIIIIIIVVVIALYAYSHKSVAEFSCLSFPPSRTAVLEARYPVLHYAWHYSTTGPRHCTMGTSSTDEGLTLCSPFLLGVSTNRWVFPSVPTVFIIWEFVNLRDRTMSHDPICVRCKLCIWALSLGTGTNCHQSTHGLVVWKMSLWRTGSFCAQRCFSLMFQAPGFAFYMLWVNILAPWIFAEAPEQDEKKAKKMERKMKRR